MRKPSLLKRLQGFQKYLKSQKEKGVINDFFIMYHKPKKGDTFMLGSGLNVAVYKESKLTFSKLGDLSNKLREQIKSKAKMYFNLDVNQVTFFYQKDMYDRYVNGQHRWKTAHYLQESIRNALKEAINLEQLREKYKKVAEIITKVFVGKTLNVTYEYGEEQFKVTFKVHAVSDYGTVYVHVLKVEKYLPIPQIYTPLKYYYLHSIFKTHVQAIFIKYINHKPDIHIVDQNGNLTV